MSHFTSEGLYMRKVAAWRDELAHLTDVLITDAGGALPEGTRDLEALLQAASTEFEIFRTEPEDMALLHFTSGTTGQPNGAVRRALGQAGPRRNDRPRACQYLTRT